MPMIQFCTARLVKTQALDPQPRPSSPATSTIMPIGIS
jgi:hypothetical protein